MAIKSFDDLLDAIVSAVSKARIRTEFQHLLSLKRFFDSDKNGKNVPKTLQVEIPNPAPGEDDTRSVNVPIMTLVPFKSVMLDEISIEFDAVLSSLTDDMNGDNQKSLQLDIGKAGLLNNKKGNMKVTISLKSTDPPEGLVRINDHLLKRIP